MVKDELVSRISSGDPYDIPSVDVRLASYKGAFAKFPRHQQREEGLFVDDLVDFLGDNDSKFCSAGKYSKKSRTSSTTTHRFPSFSVRNWASVNVEGSSYGLIE